MKRTNRIPSYLAIVAALAVIRLPILGGPSIWQERLLDPTTFLTALTLAGAAMLLWPVNDRSVLED
jgi:hypothetical protein